MAATVFISLFALPLSTIHLPIVPTTQMVASALDQRVWFITGTSTGLGRELVRAALARNDLVIATSRSIDSIRDLRHPCCAIMQLDVTASFDVIQAKAQEALRIFGRIDVVVNNAGNGSFGTMEEVGVEGFMAQFRTNIFGPMNVASAFLPHMRERRDGIIINIGSRSAWRAAVPMIGPYASSKAALRAITESLSVEVAPFGIRTLLVEPGSLRTEFASRKNAAPLPRRRSNAVYDKVHKATMSWVHDRSGLESGDPIKAAHVMVDVVRGEGVAWGRPWPKTLILGADAEHDVRAKCEDVLKNLDEWKDVSRSISSE